MHATAVGRIIFADQRPARPCCSCAGRIGTHLIVFLSASTDAVTDVFVLNLSVSIVSPNSVALQTRCLEEMEELRHDIERLPLPAGELRARELE